MNNQAFFYIDGIPTKGDWVDLDEVTTWEDVAHILSAKFPSSGFEFEEILCADVEGLPRHFYSSNCDGFSMTEWADFKEQLSGTHLEAKVIDAYLDHQGGIDDISDIEEAYAGEYDSWEDFAYELLESTGDLEQIPESLRSYFDYEKFGRDLSYDYFESNGYYFRNC